MSGEQDAIDALARGNLDAALEGFTELSRQQPAVAKHRFNVALVLFKLDRIHEALDLARMGLSMNPSDEKGRKFVAMLEQRAGDPLANEPSLTKQVGSQDVDEGGNDGHDEIPTPGSVEPEPDEAPVDESSDLARGGGGTGAVLAASTGTPGVDVVPRSPEPKLIALRSILNREPGEPAFVSFNNVHELHAYKGAIIGLVANLIDRKVEREGPIPAAVTGLAGQRDTLERYRGEVKEVRATRTGKKTGSTIRTRTVKDEAKIQEALALIKLLSNEADAGKDNVQEQLDQVKIIARKYYDDSQYDAAIDILSSIVEHFPEDLEATFNLGFAHREKGEYQASEHLFKGIIEYLYDNAYAWYNLAMIYALSNDGPKELFSLRMARDFGYPVDYQRLSRLALTYEPVNPFD